MEYIHSNIIYQLFKKIGGSVSDIDGEKVLQCYNTNARGILTSTDLNNGISYVDFNMEFSKDITLIFDFSNLKTIAFLYSLEGDFDYFWEDDDNMPHSISEIQSVITIKENGVLNIQISKESNISFGLILINEPLSSIQKTSLEEIPGHELFDYFEQSSDSDNFNFKSSLNLKIKSQLLNLRSIRQKGIVKKMLKSGIIQFAISLMILNYERDTLSMAEINGSLPYKELLNVKKAIEKVRENLETKITIAGLCREFHINPNKLQEGFKELTGETVNNFICNERLKMAEQLIKKGNMNISQVVYSVGLTSRSYFSKAFKEKYKCSPKQYQLRLTKKAVLN